MFKNSQQVTENSVITITNYIFLGKMQSSFTWVMPPGKGHGIKLKKNCLYCRNIVTKINYCVQPAPTIIKKKHLKFCVISPLSGIECKRLREFFQHFYPKCKKKFGIPHFFGVLSSLQQKLIFLP